MCVCVCESERERERERCFAAHMSIHAMMSGASVQLGVVIRAQFAIRDLQETTNPIGTSHYY